MEWIIHAGCYVILADNRSQFLMTVVNLCAVYPLNRYKSLIKIQSSLLTSMFTNSSDV